MSLEDLIEEYGIKQDAIKKNMLCHGENAYRTSAKELIGQKIIQRNDIFRHCAESLGLEYQGYKKITSKKEQKRGVDFIIHTNNGDINIDLKSEILGDYTDSNGDDVLVAEIYQNDQFTNHKGKATDYVLYVIDDVHGARAYLVDYEVLSSFSVANAKHYERQGDVYVLKNNPRYQTSNNGSGIYIKSTPTELKGERIL